MTGRVAILLCLLGVLAAGLPCHGQQDAGTTDSPARDQTDEALDRAIAFLVTRQKSDGSVSDQRYNTTMTSLSIMALAAVGHQPTDVSAEGRCMAKALAYVLQDGRQNDAGYFGAVDGSRMYGHGITTLMLTEMMGMGVDQEQDRLILDRCQKAIDLILGSQKENKPSQFRGGWRYAPNSKDADLSVSVWQLMALRSAKNDHLDVPANAIDDAVDYLKRSYASPRDREGNPTKKVSGFAYMPNQSNPTPTMSAAGLLAMQVCGQYESLQVIGASDWLLENPPQWKGRFFFYGIYYYAQGMHQRGGSHAEKADQLVRQLLLGQQQKDGSWTSASREETSLGATYATSLAVLSLSVKYHYLPIYQR